MKSSPLYNELREVISLAYENQLLSFLGDVPLEQFTNMLFEPAAKFRSIYPSMPLIVTFKKDENNPDILRVNLSGELPEEFKNNDFASNFAKSIKNLKNRFFEKNPNLTENDCFVKVIEKDDEIVVKIISEKK